MDKFINKLKIKSMKKFLFSFLALLAGCSLAWAGVKVSGTVSVTAGGYPGYLSTTDTVVLSNETFRTKANIVSNYSPETYSTTYTYSFEDIENGVYTIRYQANVSGLPVFYSAEITVDGQDVEHDITAENDPDYVFMGICGAEAISNYGYTYMQCMSGVEITCTPKGQADEAITVITSNSAMNASFLCRVDGTYTISLHKTGYRDTAFDVVIADNLSSTNPPRFTSMQAPMTEDLGTVVTLKGNVTIDGQAAKVSNLYLALTWADKTYTTQIENGAYQFETQIPTGDVTLYLCSNTYNPTFNQSKNWRFAENNDTKLAYTLTGEEDETVDKDFAIERMGVDLTGRIFDDGESPLYGVSVTMGDNSTSTDYTGAYTFNGVQEGRYTLQFSQNGYGQASQDIEIDFSEIASDSTVTLANVYLEAIASDYVFYGQLYYYDNSSYQNVYLENASVTITDSEGEKIDVVYTDENGNWEKTINCKPNTLYYFQAEHPDIETPAETSARAQSERNNVYIYCKAKGPELFGMENPSARQIEDSLKVELTWEWPEALKEGYADGSYQIMRIVVNRREQSASSPISAGMIFPENRILPPSVFIDSSSNHALEYGNTYSYFFEIYYSTPSGTVTVNDLDNLTVTIFEHPVTLTLEVNDETMGRVTGAGRYEMGATVTIEAIANTGYEFLAWMSGTETVAQTAEYTFELTSDSSLTAVFEEVIPDFVTLTLTVNDETMGSVTGAGEYEKGEEVTVTATAHTGYLFECWKEGNITVSTSAEFTFELTADRTLTAIFIDDPDAADLVTLTLNVNDPAMGSVTGAGKYEKGEEVTILATANTGYGFVAWMDGTDTVAKTAEYTFTIENDVTYTALFAVESANEVREQADWKAYAENGQIVILSNTVCRYDVFNAAGTLMKQGKANGNEYRIAVDNSGLYIIRRISATGISAKKIIVR